MERQSGRPVAIWPKTPPEKTPHMGKHELDKRAYGSRYDQTRAIHDLTVLAERILDDLSSVGLDGVPDSAEFSIWVRADALLQLQVGGLRDAFTFVDRIGHRYSREANALIALLVRAMDSYNWTNPDDPTDRRFFTSIYLLAESEYRSAFWTPGAVRAF